MYRVFAGRNDGWITKIVSSLVRLDTAFPRPCTWDIGCEDTGAEIGKAHRGQAAAILETSVLHSGHLISAMHRALMIDLPIQSSETILRTNAAYHPHRIRQGKPHY